MLTLTMFSVITRCLGFLYKIYLSRIMTTADLGIYNLSVSVYMVLITLVGSSIPLTISKITSMNNSTGKSSFTPYSITSSLILTTGLSIIISILLLVLKPLLVLLIGYELGYEIIITLIPSIIFTALYSQIRGYLWGIENYFAVSIVEFVEQILRIAMCMILVTMNIFKSPALAVGTALSIACGISTIYGFILYFRNDGKFKFKKGYFGQIIRSSSALTGVRLFGSLLQPIVAILLPIQLTKFGLDKTMAISELGIIMGMSMPLLSIPSTIIGSLCMILVPKISGGENGKNNVSAQIDAYIGFSLLCLFLFLPIFIVLGIPICDFVFGNTSAGLYLAYCCWIIVPMGLSQITTSILNALNQEQKTFIYYVISSIFMLIAVTILPRFIGINAMLFGSGISGIVLTILNFRKISKLTGYQSKIFNKLIYQMLLILPVILVTKLTLNCCNLFCNNIISIIICSIVSVVSYFILLFVFGVLNLKTMKNIFLSTFKKKSLK